MLLHAFQHTATPRLPARLKPRACAAPSVLMRRPCFQPVPPRPMRLLPLPPTCPPPPCVVASSSPAPAPALPLLVLTRSCAESPPPLPAQLIVSLPLLRTHLMPAVVDAPHGGNSSDIAVICACVIAMLCHLSARVRHGGAPLGISIATWLGAVGLLLHAAVRQPAAGSYLLHLCIFAAVLAALRRIPTLPSHSASGSSVHIGGALIVVCLLFAVQATTSQAPANAVADAVARAARATAVPATVGAASGPASGGASSGGASVGLAAGAAGADGSRRARKGVEGSRKVSVAETPVETPEVAAESAATAAATAAASATKAAAGAEWAAAAGGGGPLLDGVHGAESSEVHATDLILEAAAAGASHLDGISLAAAVGTGYATLELRWVGAADPPAHSAMLLSLLLPIALRLMALMWLPSACDPQSLAMGALAALIGMPAAAVFLTAGMRHVDSWLGLSDWHQPSSAEVSSGSVAGGTEGWANALIGACLSVLIGHAVQLRFLFVPLAARLAHTFSSGPWGIANLPSSRVLPGCPVPTSDAVSSLQSILSQLFSTAEATTLLGALALCALLLATAGRTWRLHANTPGHDRPFSLVVHSLAVLGPAALLPLALIPAPEEAILSSLLFAAASTGRVATLFLASDGALRDQPRVQAGLLAVACGLSALVSRLLEGGLQGGGLLQWGGNTTSMPAPDARGTFIRRPEFDAFAAVLPAAVGLVTFDSSSSAVGAQPADWREGWEQWARSPRLQAWRALRLAPAVLRALLLVGLLPSMNTAGGEGADGEGTPHMATLLPPALSLMALVLAAIGLKGGEPHTRTRKWPGLAYLLLPSNAWRELMSRPGLALSGLLAAAVVPVLLPMAAGTTARLLGKLQQAPERPAGGRQNAAGRRAERSAERAGGGVTERAATSAPSKERLSQARKRQTAVAATAAPPEAISLTARPSQSTSQSKQAALQPATLPATPPSAGSTAEPSPPSVPPTAAAEASQGAAAAGRKKRGKASSSTALPTESGLTTAAASAPSATPPTTSASETEGLHDDAAPMQAAPAYPPVYDVDERAGVQGGEAGRQRGDVAERGAEEPQPASAPPAAESVPSDGQSKDDVDGEGKEGGGESAGHGGSHADDTAPAADLAPASSLAQPTLLQLRLPAANSGRADEGDQAMAAELLAALAAEAEAVAAAEAAEQAAADAWLASADETDGLAAAEAAAAADAAEAAAAKEAAEAHARATAEAAAASMRAADEAVRRAAALAAANMPTLTPRSAIAPKSAGRVGETSAGRGGRSSSVADEDEPADYVCPITHEVMVDPVVTADGQSYERLAIEQWLQHSAMSPLTGEPLTHLALTPNMALRRLIQEWVASKEGTAVAAKDTAHRGRGRRGGAGSGSATGGGGHNSRSAPVGRGGSRGGPFRGGRSR